MFMRVVEGKLLLINSFYMWMDLRMSKTKGRIELVVLSYNILILNFHQTGILKNMFLLVTSNPANISIYYGLSVQSSRSTSLIIFSLGHKDIFLSFPDLAL